MDIFKVEKYLRLLIILSLLVISICGLFYVWNSFHKGNGISSEYVRLVKEQSENRIALNKKRIEYLEKKNLLLQSKINKSRFVIDSLENVKNRISYVYINKVKEIEDFNSVQLENYWKHEIK